MLPNVLNQLKMVTRVVLILLHSPVYMTLPHICTGLALALINRVLALHPIFLLYCYPHVFRCFTVTHMHSGVQGHQEWSTRSCSESSHQQ